MEFTYVECQCSILGSGSNFLIMLALAIPATELLLTFE